MAAIRHQNDITTSIRHRNDTVSKIVPVTVEPLLFHFAQLPIAKIQRNYGLDVQPIRDMTITIFRLASRWASASNLPVAGKAVTKLEELTQSKHDDTKLSC
eukprot:1167595-Amphidinium_carterae.1